MSHISSVKNKKQKTKQKQNIKFNLIINEYIYLIYIFTYQTIDLFLNSCGLLPSKNYISKYLSDLIEWKSSKHAVYILISFIVKFNFSEY